MIIVIFAAVLVLAIIAGLRFTKGIAPLRAYESVELPGFPGARGLVLRLDGVEKPNSPIINGKTPDVNDKAELVIPNKWEDGKIGRANV